jgi:hypothetical protein
MQPATVCSKLGDHSPYAVFSDSLKTTDQIDRRSLQQFRQRRGYDLAHLPALIADAGPETLRSAMIGRRLSPN